MDAWHVFKLIWLAVLCVYLVVQIIALHRLKGRSRKRSVNILMFIVVLETASSFVRDVFEVRGISRIGMAVVGVSAAFAIAFLVRLLIDPDLPEGVS